MIKLGIKKPITTLMLVIAIIIFAVASLPRLPVELYPNHEFGEISIITRLRGGIPATEVESNVTRPMEAVFSEVNGVREVSSASRESESNIVLKFYPNTNLNFAILDVREKLASIKYRLPKEVERPVIAKFQQSDVPVVIIALSSDHLSPEQLREIAEEKIKEKIARVVGVANIEIGGGQERKILIDIDNSRLLSYGLPIMNVVDMINTNNISVAAGDVSKQGERYIIKAAGEFSNVDEIGATGIGMTPSGSIISLRDIAHVADSYYEPTSFARLNVKPVVSLYIQKETSANTIKVGRQIVEKVELLKKEYAKDMTITIIKNDAEFIEEAVNDLESSVFQGAVLIGVILFVFLKNFRTIFIIISIMPIAIMLSVILMFAGGFSLNIMTLSGLAMGLGNLMDNAIIILQNIAHKAKRLKVFNTEKLVIESTQELVLPMIASTISTMIVFLPLVFLDEEIKRLYIPFGMAIAISLTAALIGTLIFLPPLCIRIKNAFTFEPPAWDKIVSGLYVKILNFVFRKQKMVFSIIVALSIATVLIFMTRDSEFIDPGNANTFRVGIQFPPGTRIERSDAIVKKIEKALVKYPSVTQVSSRVEKLHTFLEVKVRDQKETLKDVFRKRFGEFSPAFIYYQESQELSSEEVFVDFYGYDYGVLKQLAFSASGRLSQMREFSDVKIRMREDEPELAYTVYQNNLAHFGISTLYLANTIHNQLRGLVATYFRTEGKELETIARLTPGTVASAAELPYLRFITPYGDMVSLNQLGDVKQVTTTQEIWHKNKKRFIQISANRGKMGLTAAVDKMRVALTALNFPKDYSFEFSGDYEKAVKNKKDFSVAIVLTIILIYLTLASLFESYIQPLLIMTSLPLSAIGVALMLFIFKKPISLGIWIGLMILGGTVVNASIILVEKINQTREVKGLLRSIIESSKERLHSVLMTSLNNIIGLIPLVISTSDASSMWRSLGLAVMAGMFSGTFLTLFLLPTFYYRSEVPLKLSDLIPKFKKKPAKILPKILPTLQSEGSVVAQMPQTTTVNKRPSLVRNILNPVFVVVNLPGKAIKKIFGPGKKLAHKKPFEFIGATPDLVAKITNIVKKKTVKPPIQTINTSKINKPISTPSTKGKIIAQTKVSDKTPQEQIPQAKQTIQGSVIEKEVEEQSKIVLPPVLAEETKKEKLFTAELEQEILTQEPVEEKIATQEKSKVQSNPILTQEPAAVIVMQEQIVSEENIEPQIAEVKKQVIEDKPKTQQVQEEPKTQQEVKDLEQVQTEPIDIEQVEKEIEEQLKIVLPPVLTEEAKKKQSFTTIIKEVEQEILKQEQVKKEIEEQLKIVLPPVLTEEAKKKQSFTTIIREVEQEILRQEQEIKERVIEDEPKTQQVEVKPKTQQKEYVPINVNNEELNARKIEKQKEYLPIIPKQTDESKEQSLKPKKTLVHEIFGIEPLTEEQKKNRKKPVDIIKDALANLFGSTKKHRALSEKIEIRYKSKTVEKILTEIREQEKENDKNDKKI